MKVVLFIPIKLNNERLPGKNTKDLLGRPLCDYIFKTASAMSGVDEKYVYCSDEKIIPYIEQYKDSGLQFYKRDKCLDASATKGLEIIGRFVSDVDADIYIITHATQPFTKRESLEKALEAVKSGKYDSAFSALAFQDYFWKNGQPLNYDMKDIPRTQDLDPLFMETGAFFVFRKEVYEKYGQRVGKNPYICEVDQFEATDIDDLEDFKLAEAIGGYLKNNNMLEA